METGNFYEKEEEKKIDMTTEDYKNQYNPKLKESGLIIVNDGWNTFVNIFFVCMVILILIGGVYFLIQVNQGKFKTEITQPINVNSTTQNTFDFKPVTNVPVTPVFYNNYTIINVINQNCS